MVEERRAPSGATLGDAAMAALFEQLTTLRDAACAPLKAHAGDVVCQAYLNLRFKVSGAWCVAGTWLPHDVGDTGHEYGAHGCDR